MKKIFCYVASLLVATGAMVGCTEDITTDNLSNEGVNNVEFIEVVASLEADESRTTLLDNGVGKVAWSEGDTIGAILEDGTIEECSAIEINGANAKFEVPTTTKYAVYPYASGDEFADGKLTKTLVNTVTLDGTNKVFGDKENVMVAHLANKALSFKHICGFVEVKLTGTQVVKHVALRSNTRKWDALSGFVNISLNDLPEPKCVFSTEYRNEKAAFNWVYADCSDVQLSESEATSFYFVVPPRTYEDLSICVQTNEGSYAIQAKNAIEVNRAKIRPISAINLNSLKPATATDLSVNGIANCYIVPEGTDAKFYSFPAQKLNETEKLTNVAYAHVLWSDRAKLITNVNYDAATGTVSFKYAGGKAEGNAMVSVFDANHNSIWTWHIWCTDQPEAIKIKNNGAPADKYHVIMDRNIGATYAPKTLEDAAGISAENATKTLGLYYQYGRPIPFPGPTSITNTTAEATNALFGANTSDFELMYGFKDLLQCFQYSAYQNTFASMLANPLIFCTVNFTTAYGTAVGSSTDGKAYHAFCKDLPKPCTQADQLWFSENADVVSKKGNTDPCPPGYCIDDFETFKAALYNIPENRISQGDDTSNKTYGYSYQCPTTKDVVWFPANGFRTEKGVYSSVGYIANLWSARNCTYTSLYGVRWYTGNGVEATKVMGTSGINTLAWGFNIRCRVMDRTSLQK